MGKKVKKSELKNLKKNCETRLAEKKEAKKQLRKKLKAAMKKLRPYRDAYRAARKEQRKACKAYHEAMGEEKKAHEVESKIGVVVKDGKKSDKPAAAESVVRKSEKKKKAKTVKARKPGEPKPHKARPTQKLSPRTEETKNENADNTKQETPSKKPAAETKKAPVKSPRRAATPRTNRPDNLKRVEGIGPKIEQLLHNAGIVTFADLADSKTERLEEILAAAGPRYRMHKPTTWAKQSEMCRDGKWDELKAWQDESKGGR